MLAITDVAAPRGRNRAAGAARGVDVAAVVKDQTGAVLPGAPVSLVPAATAGTTKTSGHLQGAVSSAPGRRIHLSLRARY